MAVKVFDDNAGAQTIALKALAYLAGNEDWLNGFLNEAGISLHDVKSAAADLEFQAGLLDFFLQNETLLLAFAASEELAPETIVRARQRLPGAYYD